MGCFRILPHFCLSHTKILPIVQKFIEPTQASMLVSIPVSLSSLRLYLSLEGSQNFKFPLNPVFTLRLAVIDITYIYSCQNKQLGGNPNFCLFPYIYSLSGFYLFCFLTICTFHPILSITTVIIEQNYYNSNFNVSADPNNVPCMSLSGLHLILSLL